MREFVHRKYCLHLFYHCIIVTYRFYHTINNEISKTSVRLSKYDYFRFLFFLCSTEYLVLTSYIVLEHTALVNYALQYNALLNRVLWYTALSQLPAGDPNRVV